MRTSPNTLLVATLALAMLVAPLGCNSKDAGNGGGGAPASYDSPQAVFDAAKSAMEKKDYATFCGTLTPKTQNVMAGMMAMAGNMMKMLGGMAAGFGAAGGDDPEAKAKMDEMNDQIAKIDEVLKKHGLDDNALKDMNPMTMGNDPEKAKTALTAIGDKVDDKSAFIGEMMGVLDSMNDNKEDAAGPIKGSLENVEIDGDKATGEIVKTEDGAESREPIAFEKIDDSWHIDLPMDALQ